MTPQQEAYQAFARDFNGDPLDVFDEADLEFEQDMLIGEWEDEWEEDEPEESDDWIA